MVFEGLGEPALGEAPTEGGCGASERLGEPMRCPCCHRSRQAGSWPSGPLASRIIFQSSARSISSGGRRSARQVAGDRREAVLKLNTAIPSSLLLLRAALAVLGPKPSRRTGRRGGCSNLCPLRGPPTACGETVHHIDIGSGATVERVRSTARAVAEVAAATASVRPTTVWYVQHPLGRGRGARGAGHGRWSGSSPADGAARRYEHGTPGGARRGRRPRC